MLNDPIVEEVHRIREKMLEECGGDIDKLMDRIAAIGSKFPNHVNSPEELQRLIEERESKDAVQK
jgi:hypothetical protein